MFVHELLASGAERLAASGCSDARLESELLLGHLLGYSRTRLLLAAREELPEAVTEAYAALLARRLARVPLAYILGEWEFWSRPFTVSPDTLIPRPETELLVETVLYFFRDTPTSHPLFLLDLGTGSGIIPVTLALEMPGATLLALDRSPAALKIAAANAVRHGVRQRIAFVASDWTDAIACPHGFNAVVSNPPYIASDAIPDLQPEVARHEPWIALDGGPDGLAAIRGLLPGVGASLREGGLFAMEIGADQEEGVCGLLKESGWFTAISCRRDYAGHARIITALKKR